MISMIGKCIEKPFEFTIQLIENQLAKYEPSLKPKDLIILLIMGIGIGLVTWSLYIVESVIGNLFKVSASFSWLHNPFTYLVPLIAFIIGMLITLVARYIKDHKDLYNRLIDAKEHLSNISRDIGTLENFESLTVSAIENALKNSNDKPPFKEIIDALSPPNSQLKDSIEKTINALAFLDQLNRLPDKIRDALHVFMDNNLMKQQWGTLYLTFAIKLQLEPWNTAARFSRFTFIRDIDEISCFYPSADNAQAAFQQQLSDDLEEILMLVNGSLYSIMYKDLTVWNQKEYYLSNIKLYKEKNLKDLRRLFVYDDSWLTNEVYLTPLIFGALWHNESSYPSIFIRSINVDDTIVKKKNTNFLASCLINETIIEMEQENKGSNPCRYKYICESDLGVVTNYKKCFLEAWEHLSASSPKNFLEEFKKKYSSKYSEIEKRYKHLMNSIKKS